MVVDDHSWTLRALTECLAASGAIHMVGWAVSGADALLRADQFFPHLVLLDYSLGDMTGLDVARRLKRRSNPPFVAIVTAHDQKEYETAAMAAGADAFVSKWEFAERLPGLIEQAIAYCASRRG